MENFEFAKLPPNPTKKDIDDEISRLESMKIGYNNMDAGLKVILNSIYGVAGYIKFICYHYDIAQSITKMSEHLIKHTISLFNRFFIETWPDLHDVHKQMNITKIQPINHEIVNYADSVAPDTKVIAKINGEYVGEIEIRDLFSRVCKKEPSGKEYDFRNDVEILTYFGREAIFKSMKYIMRHKCDKQMWRMSTGYNSVDLTEDHSMMCHTINNERLPDSSMLFEMKPGDHTIEKCIEIRKRNPHPFEPISSFFTVEKLSNEPEYVYDVEVEDTHTFFANGILVHNTDSIFLIIKDVMDRTDYFENNKSKWKHKEHAPAHFMLELHDLYLKDYVYKDMAKYIESFNGLPTKAGGKEGLKLVLEEISNKVFWTSKKHYIKDPVWSNGKWMDPYSDITYKGLSMNSSSHSKYMRAKLKEFGNHFIINEKFDMAEYLKKLRMFKTEFMRAPLENICESMRVNNYGKFILNDKTELLIGDNCKPHTKGAGVYNYLLNKSGHRNKYEMITSGTKVLYYYTKEAEIEVFSFLPGSFPREFAPDCNREIQFEKIFLASLNTLLKALNEEKLNSSLMVYPTINLDVD